MPCGHAATRAPLQACRHSPLIRGSVHPPDIRSPQSRNAGGHRCTLRTAVAHNRSSGGRPICPHGPIAALRLTSLIFLFFSLRGIFFFFFCFFISFHFGDVPPPDYPSFGDVRPAFSAIHSSARSSCATSDAGSMIICDLLHARAPHALVIARLPILA